MPQIARIAAIIFSELLMEKQQGVKNNPPPT